MKKPWMDSERGFIVRVVWEWCITKEITDGQRDTRLMSEGGRLGLDMKLG